MKMQVYYLNDERKEVLVKVRDNRFDPVMCTGDVVVTLKPAEGRSFDLEVPEGSILFVKKWPDLVMISYAYPPAVAQLDEGLQRWVDQ